MAHGKSCEAASPKNKCRCSCKGELHGISHPEFNKTDQINLDYLGKEDQPITLSMGGEIEKFLNKCENESMICSCGNEITIEHFVGYPHDGGLEDKDGNKWWVWHLCSICKYQWSYHKIDRKIQIEKEKGDNDE